MKDLFSQDFYRNTGSRISPSRLFIHYLFSHQVRFLRVLRKANHRMTIFRKLRLWRYSRKYGLEISPNAKIGRGLYLGHPYNITVNGAARIGDNCNLHKGATIGICNTGKLKGAPIIGNCVFVGINSTIVGKVVIGDDVLIAANSFVGFDVPSHSVVIGSPGTIHHKENATAGLIIHRV